MVSLGDVDTLARWIKNGWLWIRKRRNSEIAAYNFSCYKCKDKKKFPCSSKICEGGYEKIKSAWSSYGHPEVIKENNRYAVKIKNVSLHNHGKKGRAEVNFILRNRITSAIAGKRKIKYLIKGFDKTEVGDIVIPIKKTSLIKGKEPKGEDYDVSSEIKQLSKGTKCNVCKGSGFIQCDCTNK